MSKRRWTDSLEPGVYGRLCDCCSLKSDILPLARAKYSFEKEKNADYDKWQALAEILDHLDCNSQFFDLTRAEYDDILSKIEQTHGDREYLNRDTQALTLEERARREWREIYDGDNPDNPRKFEDQFELVKFWYGMKSRGYSIGCQPKDGLIDVIDDPEGKYHDILVYDRRLTEKEIFDYELAFVKFDYSL